MARASQAIRYFSLFSIVAFVCVSTPAQQLKQAATVLAEKVESLGKKRVAVVDMVDLCGGVPRLGRFLAEELSGDLVEQARGFRVVDRSHLNAILAEHNLTAKGLIDPQTARQLGQFAGVDTLITGTITSAFGENVRVAVKALDVLTAEILAQSTIDIPKTDAIKSLLGPESDAACDVQSTLTTRQPTPSPPAVRPTSGSPRAYAGDFAVELDSCRLTGVKVICSLRIINGGTDQEFHLHANYGELSSRLFDDKGDEYRANLAGLGAQQGEGYASNRLIKDVPIRAYLTFNNVSTDLKEITALIVGCWNGRQDFTLKLQGIALSK